MQCTYKKDYARLTLRSVHYTDSRAVNFPPSPPLKPASRKKLIGGIPLQPRHFNDDTRWAGRYSDDSGKILAIRRYTIVASTSCRCRCTCRRLTGVQVGRGGEITLGEKIPDCWGCTRCFTSLRGSARSCLGEQPLDKFRGTLPPEVACCRKKGDKSIVQR